MTAKPTDPLDWRVPIVDDSGRPTPAFARQWALQQSLNNSIPNLSTPAKISAVLDKFGTATGSMLRRGATLWGVVDPLTLFDQIGAAAAVSALRCSSTVFGLAKVDGTTITSVGGVISAVGGSSGGSPAASITDDGTNVYVALSDSNGQLVLDSMGNPVFSTEVFPVAALANGIAAVKIGVIDGSDAAAGQIGEYKEIIVPSPGVTLTNFITANVAELDLDPGDWEVCAAVVYKGDNSTTQVTFTVPGITLVSATLPDPGDTSSFYYPPTTLNAVNVIGFPIGPVRYSSNTPFTVFLVADQGFNTGPLTAFGQIRARRIR